MPSGNRQNGMVRALWEIGCEENTDYHQVVGDRTSCQIRRPGCQVRVVESQVRVIERAEKRSTPQGQPIQRMHSKGMYLGLQGTRILVGFLRVAAANSAESVHARDWSNDIRAGEGLACRHWQIECTRLQVWVRARATSSVVGVPMRRATMQYWGFLEGARDFKACSAAKEHNIEVRIGGRDLGVIGHGTGLGQSPARSKSALSKILLCLVCLFSLRLYFIHARMVNTNGRQEMFETFLFDEIQMPVLLEHQIGSIIFVEFKGARTLCAPCHPGADTHAVPQRTL